MMLPAQANQADQIEIRPVSRPVDTEIRVPGSKSITNRALLMAALADGTSTLENALFSEDSHWCADCLMRLGIEIEADEAGARFIVKGQGGHFPAKSADLYVGNSGTTARFLTAAATLGHGDYHFDGMPRMRQRPIGNLLQALRGLGARFTSDGDCFPVTVHADGLRGGETELDATESSQLLSAILQVAPYATSDVIVNVTGTVVSRPYIDISLRMMAQFGLLADKGNYRKYSIRAGQKYRAQRYVIEPDASNATYFFAAAALTGGRVRVRHLSPDSLQGDTHFVDILEQMGCSVTRVADYIEVRGPGQLDGGDFNMNAISDTAQTLAAIAPFARQPVTIRDVEHMRYKETDRIKAIVTELRKLGAHVEEFPDGVRIEPSALHGAAVDTYDDHRMAMAFSVIGLVVPGIRINNPGCTAKTFPDFFTRFETLYT
jgi:3-phosphoshikimate 1-carboxyvinyltransferase